MRRVHCGTGSCNALLGKYVDGKLVVKCRKCGALLDIEVLTSPEKTGYSSESSRGLVAQEPISANLEEASTCPVLPGKGR